MATKKDTPPEELKGEELDEKVKELDVEGRSQMTADEKREAVAEVEGQPLSDGEPYDRAPDDVAQQGFFARVVSGEHEGRYGVLILDHGDGTGVLRTRDDDTARLEVKISDLRPDRAGRR